MRTGFLKFGLVFLALSIMLPAAKAQSLPTGPYAEKAAQLKEFQGNISVLKDNNPWALNLGDWVQVKQTIVTGADGYGKFQVSDGSTFEVFSNSRVIFRQNPSMMDLLDLMLGQVKVHIQRKLGGAPNPNNVRTPTAIISVRGTTFEVKAEEDLTKVDVEEGHVVVIHLFHPGSKDLYDGDTVTVFKNQPLALRKVDKGNVIQKAANIGVRAGAEVARRLPRGSTGGGSTAPTGTGGSTGGGLPTDKGSTTPPPPPPPPPGV